MKVKIKNVLWCEDCEKSKHSKKKKVCKCGKEMKKVGWTETVSY